MSLVLRDYQERDLEGIRSQLRAGITSVLYQLPTGGGKTAGAVHMIGTAAGKGNVCWFVVHRRELLLQCMRAFKLAGIKHGMVAAGWDMNRAARVQLCSVQTLAKRVARLPPPNLIVWDECHHLAAKTWGDLHGRFPEAVHIGLSATPERLDGKGLGRYFGAMVTGPTIRQLTDAGFLVPYRLFAPGSVNLTGIKRVGGDYARGELARRVDKPTITGDAVEHYRRLAIGRRAVVFAASIEHSKHVVDAFVAAGIPAAHVDGESDPLVRDRTIAEFEAGRIRVLSNVDLFGEGFDLPSIEAVILLRPTESLTIYLQQIGRALRPCPGKVDALILDHAGNCQRHGLPDEPRTWTLEGRLVKERGPKDPDDLPIRLCLKCFAVSPSFLSACRECKAPFPIRARKIAVVAGELAEVEVQRVRRQAAADQAQAQTIETLVELGRRRGYKHPERWANFVWEGRKAKRA